MRRTLMCTALLVLAAALVIPPAGAQTGPAIQIVSPRHTATVSGSLMVIEVRVQNFILAPTGIGKAAKPGQGHWAVFVDGKPAGLSADEVVSIPNDAYPILAAGKHTINVELRNNDRTPVAGAEMMTFFTEPRRCFLASSALVNRPVDSTTTCAPASTIDSWTPWMTSGRLRTSSSCQRPGRP